MLYTVYGTVSDLYSNIIIKTLLTLATTKNITINHKNSIVTSCQQLVVVMNTTNIASDCFSIHDYCKPNQQAILKEIYMFSL